MPCGLVKLETGQTAHHPISLTKCSFSGNINHDLFVNEYVTSPYIYELFEAGQGQHSKHAPLTTYSST